MKVETQHIKTYRMTGVFLREKFTELTNLYLNLPRKIEGGFNEIKL